jgi:hypothetical protein
MLKIFDLFIYSLNKKDVKMKPFILISWICAGIALILIVCGLIDFQAGGGVFGLKHSSTFFTVANTFLLFTIFFRWFNLGADKK